MKLLEKFNTLKNIYKLLFLDVFLFFTFVIVSLKFKVNLDKFMIVTVLIFVAILIFDMIQTFRRNNYGN